MAGPIGCADVFGEGLGQFDAVALIESTFGAPGRLQVIARQGSRLFRFYREGLDDWQVPDSHGFFFDRTAGIPAFVHGRYGAGNFELVTPLDETISPDWSDGIPAFNPWPFDRHQGIVGREPIHGH